MNESGIARRTERHRFALLLPMPSDLAISRLSARVRHADAATRLTGGLGQHGVFGSVRGETFDLHLSTGAPRYHDVHAFGRVSALDGLSAELLVDLRRTTEAVWVRRVSAGLVVLLFAAAVVSATRQPVFITFALFVAIVGGAIVWSMREHAGDRETLRSFILSTFPGGRSARSYDGTGLSGSRRR